MNHADKHLQQLHQDVIWHKILRLQAGKVTVNEEEGSKQVGEWIKSLGGTPFVGLGDEFEEHGIDDHYLLHHLSEKHCNALVTTNKLHRKKIWKQILRRREKVSGECNFRFFFFFNDFFFSQDEKKTILGGGK